MQNHRFRLEFVRISIAPYWIAIALRRARSYPEIVDALAQHGAQGKTDGVMDGLPVPTNMTRYFPETDEGLARRSYALHIYMIPRLVEKLSVDLSSRHKSATFTDAENEALNLAIGLMMAEGMLEIVADTDFKS